ncbi:molecular chaperone TorD family protein [Bacillaceae bacterium S4-13-56]
MQPSLTLIKKKALMEMASNRQAVYRTLALLWTEPTQELFDQVQAESSLLVEMKHYLNRMNPENPELSTGLQLLESFFEEEWPKQGQPLTEWRVEFTRLFVGPDHLPCPPYEACYREKLEDGSFGYLMGKTTLAVKNLYSEVGLEVNPPQMPDHISAELEGMALFTNMEHEAWKKDDKEAVLISMQFEQRLLGEHLTQWVPAFCQDVKTSARSNYYKALALLTGSYVTLDQTRIPELFRQAELYGK